MARRITKLVEYAGGMYEPEWLHFGPRQMIHVALNQANVIRQALAIGEGKLPKLPKGIPGDPEFCVLAQALSNGWIPSVNQSDISLKHSNIEIEWHNLADTLESYGFKDVYVSSVGSLSRPNKTRRITFRTPEAMRQLIEKFDDGEFPSLIMPMKDRPKGK